MKTKPEKPRRIERGCMFADVVEDTWSKGHWLADIQFDRVTAAELKRLRRWLDKAIPWLETKR